MPTALVFATLIVRGEEIMTEYRLVTVWRIEAPLAAVYAAVCDPLRWPEWWPDARRIEEARAGGADGAGRVLRCTWRGRLPYRLDFELITTRIEAPRAVEGVVRGDLDGVGRCLFSQTGAVTTVRHEWRVRTTRRWMNRLAPCAGPLFKRNHAQAMRRGGAGLARLLNARLLGVDHGELGKFGEETSRRADARLAAAAAGLIAGALATAVQLALWWLAAVPVAATLFRDARLTAAILMGPSVLAPTPGPRWDVLLVASLIHFALSIAYGLALARLAGRLPPGRTWLAGGLFGLALYVINLYGFTALFPWFAVARDAITALTHLAFGLLLAGSHLLLRPRRPPT